MAGYEGIKQMPTCGSQDVQKCRVKMVKIYRITVRTHVGVFLSSLHV